MNRRDFLKTGLAGIAFLSLKTLGCTGAPGSGGDSGGSAFALTIGAALFEMIDGRKVFMWSFEDPQTGPRVPGPVIRVREGERVTISVTNTLGEDHAFAVPGVAESGVIRPGGTAVVTFTAPTAGTYLYLDPLNEPVNRVLGLHGAMLVLPKRGNIPYGAPTPAVQRLFDDLGTTPHFPRHALSLAGWQPDRFRIWLQNQVDPAFNALAENGVAIDPADMRENFLPRYFTINGRSGAFASHDPDIVLSGRIGQPMLVRILNAGLFSHSNHLHANHFYVTAVNNAVQENVFALDTFTVSPGDRVDWLVPFTRPPDIAGDPNIRLRHLIPNELALTIEGPNGSPGVPQSPLVFPMHCHVEMSQTAAGGNYPQGIVTHFEFLGDIDGVDFPHAAEMGAMSARKGEGAPLPVVPRGEVPPDETADFFKHVCPPAFGGPNPDPQEPDRVVERNLLVGIDLLLPDNGRVPMWVLEDPADGTRTFPAKTIRVVRDEVVRCVTGCREGTHTIHWHGIEPTPMNDGVGKHSFEVDGNFDYQWQPREAGTYFYHCHKNTTLHFEMGLYGLLIVDPDVAGAPFADGGPGFAAAFSPATGHVIPYDVEAFWVADEIDSRWHDLGHDAFMQKCDPDDPVNRDDFTQDGFLNDFRPDIFVLTGAARHSNDIAPFTAADTPLAAPTVRVGETLLVRTLNAGYTVQQFTLGTDAEVIAMDGRALGVPPAQQYSRPFRLPAGTPFRLTSARRRDLVIRPAVAGSIPVSIEFFDSINGRLLHTARTSITVIQA